MVKTCNVINFFALQCSKFAATQVCGSAVLTLLLRLPQDVEMPLFLFVFNLVFIWPRWRLDEGTVIRESHDLFKM